jgi:hypothetical protein
MDYHCMLAKITCQTTLQFAIKSSKNMGLFYAIIFGGFGAMTGMDDGRLKSIVKYSLMGTIVGGMLGVFYPITGMMIYSYVHGLLGDENGGIECGLFATLCLVGMPLLFALW